MGGIKPFEVKEFNPYAVFNYRERERAIEFGKLYPKVNGRYVMHSLSLTHNRWSSWLVFERSVIKAVKI